jgi:hypothetical protein
VRSKKNAYPSECGIKPLPYKGLRFEELKAGKEEEIEEIN